MGKERVRAGEKRRMRKGRWTGWVAGADGPRLTGPSDSKGKVELGCTQLFFFFFFILS